MESVLFLQDLQPGFLRHNSSVLESKLWLVTSVQFSGLGRYSSAPRSPGTRRHHPEWLRAL